MYMLIRNSKIFPVDYFVFARIEIKTAFFSVTIANKL